MHEIENSVISQSMPETIYRIKTFGGCSNFGGFYQRSPIKFQTVKLNAVDTNSIVVIATPETPN